MRSGRSPGSLAREFEPSEQTIRNLVRQTDLDEGSPRALAKKRGPRPSGRKREAKKVRKLERENARLREELRKARIVIEVQGKVAGLLGVSLGDGKSCGGCEAVWLLLRTRWRGSMHKARQEPGAP